MKETSIDPNIISIITHYLNLQQEAADNKAGSVRAELASLGRDLGHPETAEVIEAQEDYWSSEAASWGNTSTAWGLANS